VSLIFYNIFLAVYKLAVSMVAPFNKKAQLWKAGRQSIFEKLENAIDKKSSVLWMHCASLGEFEQGRPVLDKIREDFPEHKILLTFFSPSGYEIRKNYKGVDWVFYLPLDSKFNAQRFIEIANPRVAIFVKYEYWYYYLHALQKNKIPVILISAIFRKDAVFFKWYGGLHRRMLACFSHIFVQNEESFQRIKDIIKPDRITLAGDTRFDRVVAIADAFEPVSGIDLFIQNKKVMVAGSTWPDDENHLRQLFESDKLDMRLIIAPHEINETHLKFLKELFPGSVFYSQLSKEKSFEVKHNVLIIDNIGMLSRLYYYATICYIGGGFNKSGIHNTLEAAVYGKPVIFGPNYQKFGEAIELIHCQGGISYISQNDLNNSVLGLINNKISLDKSSTTARNFVRGHTGASSKIMKWLRQWMV